jgi:hypothetical protein
MKFEVLKAVTMKWNIMLHSCIEVLPSSLGSKEDGSKINKGTGAIVYGYGTRKKPSFSLGKYTTVFQA